MCSTLAASFCCALLATAGCGNKSQPPVAKPTTAPSKFVVPASLQGTIASVAYLEGGSDMLVHGYGVIVGLGDKGSSEVPPSIRKGLEKQMRKYAFANPGGPGNALDMDLLLKDRDTAVVQVSALLPPGIPKGSRIDAYVQALPQTQTMSLEGGVLWTTELTVPELQSGGAIESLPKATAEGAVFVNPFYNSSDSTKNAAGLREGRVIGGVAVLESRKLRLVLRQNDYGTAKAIEEKINTRFEYTLDDSNSGQTPHPRNGKVGIAANPSFVEIWIPAQFRNDYDHFLKVVMHLYLGSPSAEEARARQLAKDILLPGASYEDIALTWEAMGRQYLPIMQELYGSENPAASFYAALAGSRLGDRTAVDVLIQAAQSSSPYQMAAIAELGRSDDVEASASLQKLLDSRNEMVRLAAYEALCASRFHGSMQRINVDNQFTLDVVPSQRDFTIYVTQTQEPRIALFGPAMQVNHPVFFNAPGDMLTVHCGADDSALKVYRRVGARRALSDEYEVPFAVKDLVVTLGQIPHRDAKRKMVGLGLTYSQIVSVLYRLADQKAVPARFVLQKIDAASKIEAGTPTIGRPDTAEKAEKAENPDAAETVGSPDPTQAEKVKMVDQDGRPQT